jgi:cytochrome c-type biogenesis protein CcmE
MTRKRRRLYLVIMGMLALGASVGLVLNAISADIVFFYSPTDLVTKHIPEGRRMRIGGLVERGTLKRDGKTVTFRITDNTNSIPVTYTGILPDLFREGQGVVAEGRIRPDGIFGATEILAKHDQKYMPPQVVEELKKHGEWKGGKGP